MRGFLVYWSGQVHPGQMWLHALLLVHILKLIPKRILKSLAIPEGYSGPLIQCTPNHFVNNIVSIPNYILKDYQLP